MKKILFVFGAMIFTTTAMASSLLVMKEVVMSEAAKEATQKMAAEGYQQLQKVELSATYRCPGCFDYTMTFSKVTEQGKVQNKTAVLTTTGFGKLKVGIKELGGR